MIALSVLIYLLVQRTVYDSLRILNGFICQFQPPMLVLPLLHRFLNHIRRLQNGIQGISYLMSNHVSKGVLSRDQISKGSFVTISLKAGPFAYRRLTCCRFASSTSSVRVCDSCCSHLCKVISVTVLTYSATPFSDIVGYTFAINHV